MEVSLCQCIEEFFKYSVIFSACVQINVPDKDDPYIETAGKVISHLGAASTPGAF
jgi:hypothetical protein